ncbi:UDP-N-acetylmuramate--L-alanine ligase [Aureitalea marina]|uniref:UDP-N-acetylmuramate--L-alanine ligase n=1 Tax=Aureitalea marina TaxID=930804 RepID=A0A2S7KM29_9FLAO|nr:cyanophycin synthetase [Aureitalea marina]PQB03684.1 UDP-N-acetylmuramate--L-alanine ligase [Aureitalea marina]
MKGLKHIDELFFIGIGGIGMSALARYFNARGYAVSGYDRTRSPITEQLEEEGITINYLDIVSPEMHGWRPENVRVIYTPAIPTSNTIFTHFENSGFELLKRADLLQLVTAQTNCLAVAGTHGKTTTSAILGHLMAACDMPVTAFLGGILENYQSNFIDQGDSWTVVEADEFDRSFLKLSPWAACITTVDADHLDIYGSADELTNTFRQFSALITENDRLLVGLDSGLDGSTVAVDQPADYYATNIRISKGSYLFDLITPHTKLEDLVFHLPGHHNLHNAVNALGLAILAGAPTDRLPEALFNFKGVHRRFSYRIRREDLILIDDYAHHPTEINALFQAVDEMYPGERKLIVFQPHLYSRTRDFAAGFANSLNQFDQVVLLDIYPAREEPIEGVTSDWLMGLMKHPDAALVRKEELPETISNSNCMIKLMVGAGDIGEEVSKITQVLSYAS